MSTGTLHNDFEEAAVYRNTVEAFSIWWVTLVYLASMVALAMHLYHGMWSMFQTLGQNSPRANGSVRLFATASAVILFVGFSALPVAVYFGGLD